VDPCHALRDGTGLRYTPKLEAQKYYKFSDFIIYHI
jgi:hypothetical protein